MQSHILGGMLVGYMAGLAFGPYKIDDYTKETLRTGYVAGVICMVATMWQLTDYLGVPVQKAILPSLLASFLDLALIVIIFLPLRELMDKLGWVPEMCPQCGEKAH